MTEKQWLACDRPHWMLAHLRPWKAHKRKLCLYVCASCCRPNLNRLKVPCQNLLDVAERHADGLVGWQEYKAAKQAVSKRTKRDKLEGGPNGPPLLGQVLLDFLRLKHLPGWEGVGPAVERHNYLGDEARRTREAMFSSGMAVISEEQAIEVQAEYDAFMEEHTNLLRDIFGNPFRPVAINPAWIAWNNGTVIKLAQGIYEDRAFDRLPVLADALEEAGCDDADILGHCRHPGPHVRGCWLIDLLTAKE